MPSKPSKVIARAYLSPTLVLLAFDWPGGAKREDFLGFAIRRSPGHGKDHQPDFLFNKIGFTAPKKGEKRPPQGSDKAPIQKFMWWDAGINDGDRGQKFDYTIFPAVGTGQDHVSLLEDEAATVTVTIPTEESDGIATYFNRAVVSSQAFQEKFPNLKEDIEAAKAKAAKGQPVPAAVLARVDAAMEWLANGMQRAVPSVVDGAKGLAGAAYHLTDDRWIIPALKEFSGSGNIAYYLKERRSGGERRKTARAGATRRASDDKGDTVNKFAVAALESRTLSFDKRTKTNIMHDKFVVRFNDAERTDAANVVTGSANFTPEGLTTQANVLHVFESPELAAKYAARQTLLTGDPTIGDTAKHSGWSDPIAVGEKSKIRVFFPPEPSKSRKSIDQVVNAVKRAKRSVIFCLFSPTDRPLLDALLGAGTKGKMMFGLLNAITDPADPKKKRDPDKPVTDAAKIQTEIYHRSRKDKKILAYDYFRPGNAPAGFLPELSTIDTSLRSIVPPAPPPKPGQKQHNVPPVHIHHKFIVIDAESEHPIIYTGSANMSKNSVEKNDENLLEIKDNPELARTYLAEFMRLYDHFRARALWDYAHGKQPATAAGKKKAALPVKKKPAQAVKETFTLKTKRSEWDRGAYSKGTEAYFVRRNLAR